MPEQLTHSENRFTEKQFPITLVCDNIILQANIGALFRTCEAFGVEHIIFIGKDIPLTPRKLNRYSRSTHLKVPYTIIKTTEEALLFLTQNNFQLLALEITGSSLPISTIQPNNRPVALIAGSENEGISPQLLAAAHTVCHVEMYGSNSSMNVSQAVAIALYEITNRLL